MRICWLCPPAHSCSRHLDPLAAHILIAINSPRSTIAAEVGKRGRYLESDSEVGRIGNKQVKGKIEIKLGCEREAII